ALGYCLIREVAPGVNGEALAPAICAAGGLALAGGDAVQRVIGEVLAASSDAVVGDAEDVPIVTCAQAEVVFQVNQVARCGSSCTACIAGQSGSGGGVNPT